MHDKLVVNVQNNYVNLRHIYVNLQHIYVDIKPKYVCLFAWGFSPTREFFTHLETLPLPAKGCKFLTYHRHSWPLISEGSLTCHTYCNLHGPSLYNGHLQRPVALTPVAERLAVELSLPAFITQVCPDRGSNPDLPHAKQTLYPTPPRRNIITLYVNMRNNYVNM